jgi:AAA domain-containing protein
MAIEAQHAPTASQALLPTWANDQDGWCRTIAADVLKNRVQPSNLDVDRYLKLLLAEKKLSDTPFEPVPKIEEKELDANALETVRLDSIKVGDGINALKPGAQIDFAPGVTVIFGENGSGKSGFVRVLKRAAGARTAEDILHNVRSEKRPTPTASSGRRRTRFDQKVVSGVTCGVHAENREYCKSPGSAFWSNWSTNWRNSEVPAARQSGPQQPAAQNVMLKTPFVILAALLAPDTVSGGSVNVNVPVALLLVSAVMVRLPLL